MQPVEAELYLFTNNRYYPLTLFTILYKNILIKRDTRIDILLEIAILLMVLGDTNFIGMHFIYMFHIAVFFYDFRIFDQQ